MSEDSILKSEVAVAELLPDSQTDTIRPHDQDGLHSGHMEDDKSEEVQQDVVMQLSSQLDTNSTMKPSEGASCRDMLLQQTSQKVTEVMGVTKQPEMLMEHESLTEMLCKIPQKVQRGLKTHYELLELTSIDANQYFIALGSNVGTVYLFDREKCTFQKLKSENSSDSVTCVSLHHGLDDLVGIGFTSGTIYIFQLPSIMMGHSKKLERFVVADICKSPVSCLTWSTNGMKLFSGDRSGCVGCVQVDFYEGKSESSVLLIEQNTEIVQLNYSHKSLLVSTKHRCFVYRTDPHDQIVQIGSKDRKLPAEFGACFIRAMCKPDDAQLYASRPGLRIWKASINGSVLNTFIFKDLLTQANLEIPLLKFEVTNILKPQNPNQFGPLLLFREKELVTWNDNCLYVLNPENLLVIGVQKHIGAIKSVTVSEHEIFVLRTGTDRNLIRISDRPAVRPTSRLLKLLEAERNSADNKLDAYSKEKHSSKQELAKADNSEKVTLDTKKEEMSPFKAFGGHFLEKVKQLPKQLELKEKIQEKLSLEKKFRTVSSNDTKNPLMEKDPSPISDLPPVIKWESPDPLFIKVGEKVNATENVEVVAGTSGNKTDIVGAIDQEIFSMKYSFPSQENPTDKPIKRHGSGASFALARLQEDHLNEECSDPIYKMAEQSSFKTRPLIVQGEDDENSIVYKKVKPKHSKKKARSPKIFERKPDVDQNQTTTITSERVSGASDNSYNENRNNLAPINFQPEPKLGTESHSVDKDENITNVECLTLPQTKVVSDSFADQEEIEPKLEFKISRESQSEMQDHYLEQCSITNATELTSEVDSGNIAAHANEKEISASEGKEIESQRVTSETSTVNGVDKLAVNVETELVSTTNEQVKLYCDDGKMSSLDREMAKLESYLGGNSTSCRNVDGESDKQSFEEQEENISNASDTYTPSALEQELRQLEMSTATETSATIRDKTLDHSSSTTIPYENISSLNKHDVHLDDFYSSFSLSTTEVSPDLKSSKSMYDKKFEATSDEIKTDNVELLKASPYLLTTVNIWGNIMATGNIHSLSASSTHVWITDKSCNIYYYTLAENKICWKKASGNASQISVSKNGNILWGLYKNIVYAATKITAHRPEGCKWVEAIRDVAYISVDETCAWYIKVNMQVMMQKGLSRERPCYKAQEVLCVHRLKQIECQSGVVWALTENCKWLYRSGITSECLEGKEWVFGDTGIENHLFSHIALGDSNLGWAIDVAGQVWFCTGVTIETPIGDNQWWQVSLMGEYIFKDMSTMDLLKSFSKKMDPQKLSLLLSSQSGGLIAGVSGVWVCPEYQNVLHVCRGNIEGHVWKESTPGNLPNTTCWKSIVVSTAHIPNGMIWAQQPNGDLFAFSLEDQQICRCIPGPVSADDSILFLCMSVCTDALWGLTSGGVIYIRTGVTELVPVGFGWSQLDLSQLDHCQLVHVSCSRETVWAVDSNGNVYHRIGVKAPTDCNLNAAWLPVDNEGIMFTQVVAGEQDWMVWAIDSRKQVYVRSGITDLMPIGTKWMPVSGTAALQLALSRHYVWGLNHSGELLCRHGVRHDNVTGDYWKKFSVDLTYISTTPNNQLWGINRDGQIVQRHTKYVIKGMKDLKSQGTSHDTWRYSTSNDDAEWYIV